MLVYPLMTHMSHGTRSPWSDQMDDAVRGLASGLLVGIPVVFTVDSWWLGDQTTPLDSLFLLALSYVLTLATVYWIGFRRGVRRGWEHWADALEALALAILSLLAIFWTLGQIGNGQPMVSLLGRVAVASTPVALGVAIANHLLPRDATRYAPDPGDATALRRQGFLQAGRRSVVELVAALAGATFLCVSIVPIDDLSAISTDVPHSNLPWVILLSLLVSYCVVFAAGFAGESHRHASSDPLQHPLTETVIAYIAALIVSAAFLWIFGRIDVHSTPTEIYTKTILLAFPASMASAAGRLAV